MKKLFVTILIILLLPRASLALEYDWYIPSNDMKYAYKANHYANKNRWLDVKKEAYHIKDPLIKKIFQWRQYAAISKHTTFEEISSFVKENPHFPTQDVLRKNVELTLNENVPPQKIISWFRRKNTSWGSFPYHDPITANGALFLAEALISEGNGSDGFVKNLIRRAWIESSFSAKQEWAFLAKYKNLIRVEDYIERINHLLWEDEIKQAQRILDVVDAENKALFKARIALKTQRYGVDKAVDAVPNRLKDNGGLIYDRIRWREKYKNSASMDDMLKIIPSIYDHPDKWWDLKKKYVLDLIKKKQYKLAHTLAEHHNFNEDLTSFAEAEWLSGWITLRFLKDYKNAYEHFHNIYQKVETPISRGRAAYWAGRAAESDGNTSIAKKWYEVGSNYVNSFYGQLSINKLGNEYDSIPKPPTPTWADENHLRNNEIVKAAYILSKLEKHGFGRKFIKHAVKNAKTIGESLTIARMGNANNISDYSVAAAREASKDRGSIFLKEHYPVIKDLKDARGNPIIAPEKALIHSVILQESMFNPTAQSHVGAAGMMQLMPATAREVSGYNKLRYSKDKLYEDKAYNITLGSDYLSRLINDYRGSYILGVCAYNAGAGNVNKWIKANGDPRTFKTAEEVIDWIEMIPFSETRSYVQRVIENLQIYRYILGHDLPLYIKTSKDIMR